MSAVPQHFQKDANGNIWVSLVSNYGAFPNDSLGLAVINPLTNTVTNIIKFSGMGSAGYLAMSADKSKIYTIGADAWPGTASQICEINVATKTITNSALISGENFYGFGVNPKDNNIYVLISPSVSANGILKVYNSAGTLLDTKETGIAPQQVLFLD